MPVRTISCVFAIHDVSQHIVNLIQEFAAADIGGHIDLEKLKLLLEGLDEAGLPARP